MIAYCRGVVASPPLEMFGWITYWEKSREPRRPFRNLSDNNNLAALRAFIRRLRRRR